MIQAEGLPDNPTVFEKNLSAFKKSPEKLFDFLKKIKSDYLQNLYKKKDIPTDNLM